jgi:hypothetical protein
MEVMVMSGIGRGDVDSESCRGGGVLITNVNTREKKTVALKLCEFRQNNSRCLGFFFYGRGPLTWGGIKASGKRSFSFR